MELDATLALSPGEFLKQFQQLVREGWELRDLAFLLEARIHGLKETNLLPLRLRLERLLVLEAMRRQLNQMQQQEKEAVLELCRFLLP